MLANLLKPEILALIEERSWAALRDVVEEWPAPEVADLLLELERQDRVLLFRALSREFSADVFSHLELSQQDDLLEDLTNEETRRLLADLPPDDRTHLLEELPGEVVQRLLGLLSREDLAEARSLLGYPEESVGRLMTPDYLAVRPHWTIARVLAHIRARGPESETINVIFVTGGRGQLQGMIHVKRLLWADLDEERAEDLLEPADVRLSPFDDRERAVHVAERYDLNVIPVTDSAGIMLGIVTVDDVLDVAAAEATEDFHKLGTVEPLRTSIRDAALSFLYRRRIGWLVILVVFNIFSGAGIAHFEDTIATAFALVMFLPLLIASAGNAGSQAATLMVRALATGDVEHEDWLHLFGRELLVASALGLTMALAVSPIAYFAGDHTISLVVASSMIVIVVIGSILGMSLPFLLGRLNMDPATASAPLVTSICDVTGVIIYFTIATWMLGL
jgi:magnesium transporter